MKRVIIGLIAGLVVTGCATEQPNYTYRSPQPYNWGIPTNKTTTYTPPQQQPRRQSGPPPGCRNPVYNKGLGFWQCLDAVNTSR